MAQQVDIPKETIDAAIGIIADSHQNEAVNESGCRWPCRTAVTEVLHESSPHIRANERRRIAAALDGCLSTLLARGRIDDADRDAIRASIGEDRD